MQEDNKILIVDDDSLVLKLFSIISEDKNRNMIYCDSPEEALEIIRSDNKIKRVIADYFFKNSNLNGSDILKEAEIANIEERVLITSVSPIKTIKDTHATVGVRKPLTKKSILKICFEGLKDITLNGLI
jgi:DNA-binding NtrC family response regulator